MTPRLVSATVAPSLGNASGWARMVAAAGWSARVLHRPPLPTHAEPDTKAISDDPARPGDTPHCPPIWPTLHSAQSPLPSGSLGHLSASALQLDDLDNPDQSVACTRGDPAGDLSRPAQTPPSGNQSCLSHLSLQEFASLELLAEASSSILIAIVATTVHQDGERAVRGFHQEVALVAVAACPTIKSQPSRKQRFMEPLQRFLVTGQRGRHSQSSRGDIGKDALAATPEATIADDDEACAWPRDRDVPEVRPAQEPVPCMVMNPRRCNWRHDNDIALLALEGVNGAYQDALTAHYIAEQTFQQQKLPLEWSDDPDASSRQLCGEAEDHFAHRPCLLLVPARAGRRMVRAPLDIHPANGWRLIRAELAQVGEYREGTMVRAPVREFDDREIEQTRAWGQCAARRMGGNSPCAEMRQDCLDRRPWRLVGAPRPDQVGDLGMAALDLIRDAGGDDLLARRAMRLLGAGQLPPERLRRRQAARAAQRIPPFALALQQPVETFQDKRLSAQPQASAQQSARPPSQPAGTEARPDASLPSAQAAIVS